MKKSIFPRIIGTVILAAGIFFSFPYLRRFIRTGSAAIIYKIPEVRSDVMNIACIGDSITYGAGVADAEGNRPDESTWPYMLEEQFNHEVQILNYGVCGRTLMKKTGAGYSETDFYKRSLESGAEGFLILLGTNDSKTGIWNSEAYKDELEKFVNSYLSLPGNPEVVLVTPPRAFGQDGSDNAVYDIRNDVIRDEIVPVIKDTAARLGIRCFDLYAETENHPEWFADGVHPNMEGNRGIAEFLHRSIMG